MSVILGWVWFHHKVSHLFLYLPGWSDFVFPWLNVIPTLSCFQNLFSNPSSRLIMIYFKIIWITECFFAQGRFCDCTKKYFNEKKLAIHFISWTWVRISSKDYLQSPHNSSVRNWESPEDNSFGKKLVKSHHQSNPVRLYFDEIFFLCLKMMKHNSYGCAMKVEGTIAFINTQKKSLTTLIL